MVMARIYANCAEYDKALDEIELILSLGTHITVNTLKLKHWLDPMREHEKYKELIDKYEGITF